MPKQIIDGVEKGIGSNVSTGIAINSSYDNEAIPTDKELWAKFIPAKVNSGTINIIGDSISAGASSSPYSNSWVSLMTAGLFGVNQENCTDSEIISNFNGEWVTGLTRSGTTSYGTKGPTNVSLKLGVGGKLTFTGTYDYIDFYYYRHAGAGSLEFRRDGTLFSTINCSGATEEDVLYSGNATSGTGSHTYEITAITAEVELTALIRYNSPGTNGRIHVNRMAHSGYNTADMLANINSITKQGIYPNTSINALTAYNHYTFWIVALGTNNIYYNPKQTTPEQYENELEQICHAIWFTNVYNRIIIRVPEIADESLFGALPLSIAYSHEKYVDACYRVAKSYGAIVVDDSSIPFKENSWFSPLDGLHPTNTGHRAMYNLLKQRVVYGDYNMPIYFKRITNPTGYNYFFQPILGIARTSAGSSVNSAFVMNCYKEDNFNATGTLMESLLIDSVLGSGTIDRIGGISHTSYVSAAGAVVTSLEGYNKDTITSAGTTVSNIKSFVVKNATGAGTVTNQYGLYCDQNLNKGATNNYLIYSSNANTKSLHVGDFISGRFLTNGTTAWSLDDNGITYGSSGWIGQSSGEIWIYNSVRNAQMLFNYANINGWNTLIAGSATDASSLHSHTVENLNNTTATGAQLNTLTAGSASDASSLHSHTVENLNNTTATGAQLDTLTGGSTTDASALHAHPTIAATIATTGNTVLSSGIYTLTQAGSVAGSGYATAKYNGMWKTDAYDNTSTYGILACLNQIYNTGAGAIINTYATESNIVQNNSSSSITNGYSYKAGAVVVAGTIANQYHFFAPNATGGGSVTAQYGLYVESLIKGSTNWAVYTAGTTNSYFGGFIYEGSKEVVSTNSLTSKTVSTAHTYLTGTAGASFAVTLPAATAANDGKKVVIMSTASRASTTWASTGGSVVGGPATMAANTPYCFHLNYNDTTWYISL